MMSILIMIHELFSEPTTIFDIVTSYVNNLQ